jgi:hypothetical protein
VLDRILRRLQALVRASEYVMTLHGHEEMEADGLTVYDVEHVILTGRIVERQRDQRRKEWKYLVEGATLAGDAARVVGKIGPTGKLIIVTVYAL